MTSEPRQGSDTAPTSRQPCDICAHADAHGWWGTGHQGTHCRACHRSWTGLAEAHCPACHRHFGSNSTAERHRTRHGRCLDPATVRHKDGTAVFRLTRRRTGTVWVVDRRQALKWWDTPNQ